MRRSIHPSGCLSQASTVSKWLRMQDQTKDLGEIPMRSPQQGRQIEMSHWAIVWRCLRGLTFRRFGTVPASEGQTADGQTGNDSWYRASIYIHIIAWVKTFDKRQTHPTFSSCCFRRWNLESLALKLWGEYWRCVADLLYLKEWLQHHTTVTQLATKLINSKTQVSQPVRHQQTTVEGTGIQRIRDFVTMRYTNLLYHYHYHCRGTSKSNAPDCRSAAWVVVRQAASEKSEGHRRQGDEYMLALQAPTVCRLLSPPSTLTPLCYR